MWIVIHWGLQIWFSFDKQGMQCLTLLTQPSQPCPRPHCGWQCIKTQNSCLLSLLDGVALVPCDKGQGFSGGQSQNWLWRSSVRHGTGVVHARVVVVRGRPVDSEHYLPRVGIRGVTHWRERVLQQHPGLQWVRSFLVASRLVNYTTKFMCQHRLFELQRHSTSNFV